MPLSILLCAALSGGCSKQAEGERCDPNNFDLDCDTGLVCNSGSQLSIVSTPGAGLCCPVPPAEPSVDACRAGAMLEPEPEMPEPETPEPETPAPDAGETTPPAPDAGNVPAPDAGVDGGS